MHKIIFVHIKILRGNFFLLISNNLSELLFNKTCGGLGFKNIEKRNREAFQKLLTVGIQYILNLETKNNFFIKIEGATKEFLQQIYIQFINKLVSYKRTIFAIKLLNKTSHNGCRKPYFKK